MKLKLYKNGKSYEKLYYRGVPITVFNNIYTKWWYATPDTHTDASPFYSPSYNKLLKKYDRWIGINYNLYFDEIVNSSFHKSTPLTIAKDSYGDELIGNQSSWYGSGYAPDNKIKIESTEEEITANYNLWGKFIYDDTTSYNGIIYDINKTGTYSFLLSARTQMDTKHNKCYWMYNISEGMENAYFYHNEEKIEIPFDPQPIDASGNMYNNQWITLELRAGDKISFSTEHLDCTWYDTTKEKLINNTYEETYYDGNGNQKIRTRYYHVPCTPYQVLAIYYYETITAGEVIVPDPIIPIPDVPVDGIYVCNLAGELPLNYKSDGTLYFTSEHNCVDNYKRARIGKLNGNKNFVDYNDTIIKNANYTPPVKVHFDIDKLGSSYVHKLPDLHYYSSADSFKFTAEYTGGYYFGIVLLENVTEGNAANIFRNWNNPHLNGVELTDYPRGFNKGDVLWLGKVSMTAGTTFTLSQSYFPKCALVGIICQPK